MQSDRSKALTDPGKGKRSGEAFNGDITQPGRNDRKLRIMERQIIEFRVNGDRLEMLTPFNVYASGTVNYIEARVYGLEDVAWTGYDNVYAIWYTDFAKKESEIIDGVTIIPPGVLSRPGKLRMNLCANKSEDGILTARNTSNPVNVLGLKKTRV